MLGYLLDQTASLPTVPTIQNIGRFTLNPNATTTVVVAPITAASKVFFSPTTQDAANDMATTSIVEAVGSFTVTHANNPRVDRTFDYMAVG
jgi:hypothetical protein